VEAAAAAPDLDGIAAAVPRERLVRALSDLADLLLTHLAFEEKAVAPAMRAWTSWPET
jgi:hypothetical protein